MATIYILHGFFGSGKSTWAKNFVKEHSGTKIVSGDGFRLMFNGEYKYVPELDNAITQSMADTIFNLLTDGYDVIVDCGNLTESRRLPWLRIPAKHIAVIFPSKDKEWHIKNNVAKIHSDSWDEVWESEHKSYEPIMEHEKFHDVVIHIEEWEGN